MTDPGAPTPSVEAILHAIIPFTFVDHTHADAVVTVSNTPGGEARIRKIYGDRVLVVPYVMPGFVLARKVFEMTRATDWSKLEGIILLNHGIFTYGETARESYEKMISLVTECENFLERETKMPEFLEHVYGLVSLNVEDYIARGFENLSVAFGCTGGQHRSVYAADALARHLRNKFKVKIELKHMVQDEKNWVN